MENHETDIRIITLRKQGGKKLGRKLYLTTKHNKDKVS